MKRRFTLHNKLKMAILLLIVFGVVLVKNLVEKRHVSELSDSFASVYEDRLLVEGYIYSLSNHLHTKKTLTSSCASPVDREGAKAAVAQQNAAIRRLLSDYEKTELTPDEARHLQGFKTCLVTLHAQEDRYLDPRTAAEEAIALETQLNASSQKAFEELQALSEIQLSVGKDLHLQSQQITAEASVFSQFGWTLVIVIGLIVQVLLFSSRESVAEKPKSFRLN
jgi:hypothetical protein